MAVAAGEQGFERAENVVNYRPRGRPLGQLTQDYRRTEPAQVLNNIFVRAYDVIDRETAPRVAASDYFLWHDHRTLPGK